jgi:hypothetical protein
MIGRQQRLYLPLAGRLLRRRPRPRAWLNFGLYRLLLPFVRRFGPDRLPFQPVNAMLWVTSRCNRACPFCQYDGGLNTPEAPAWDLTAARFETLLKAPARGRRAAAGALRRGAPAESGCFRDGPDG